MDYTADGSDYYFASNNAKSITSNGVKEGGDRDRDRKSNGSSPQHSSDEDDDDDEGDEGGTDGKDRYNNDDEEDDDDEGDEGFGLDTVTEVMMRAKSQERQSRSKGHKKLSMLSLLLPSEGDRDRDRDGARDLGADMGPGSPSGGNFSRNVGSWFRRRVGKGEDTKVGDVKETAAFNPIDYSMEVEGDVRYCPASIEVNDRRRDGRRRVLFVLPWGNDGKHCYSDMM